MKLNTKLVFLTQVILLVCLLLFNSQQLYSQNDKIKELESKLIQEKNDTSKVKIMVRLAIILGNSSYTQSIQYAKKALRLAQEIKYTSGQIDALNCIADNYWYQTNYIKAQEYYFNAYRLADSIQDEEQIAQSLYNIGWIKCIQQHQYDSDKFLYKSYQIYKKLNNNSGKLQVLNALASYFTDRYIDEKKRNWFDSSLKYFNIGIELAKLSKKQEALGRIYGNLGSLFYNQGDYYSAIYYNDKSIEINLKTGDSLNFMTCYLNKAVYSMELKDASSAITILNQVLNYSSRYGLKDMQQQCLDALSKAHALQGNHNSAYNYLVQYVQLHLALDKDAYANNLTNLQNDYELEKSDANIKQLTQANEIQELKNNRKSYFIIALLAVAGIVVFIASLLFKQNKQKQIANQQLKAQNKIIAEKKLEIEQSIQYAKGIQQAVLPNKQELNTQIPNSFVYYKPKDVVSGDFYWFGKLDSDFYCIAADCTGHGVPGALMSIIGIDKLTQILFEKRVSHPSEILSQLNIEIKRILKQHSDTSKQMDGMDLALLKFNNTFTQVEYAGANRPLFLVRENKLTEYKADKIAIAGYTSDEQVYSTTKIELQKQDMLYIFTDGYADQFGGESGKKFMTKNLKDLFIKIEPLSSQEQEQQIDTVFKTWKGTYEQVDDILVMGFKV